MKIYRQFFADLKKYKSYMICAAKAELKTEVADSYLNWVWWILEPFCLMLVYTFIFGFVFDKSEAYFPLFIFIGLTLWNFFSVNERKSATIVRRYKSVVSRVYLPKVVLLIVNMMTTGFKMCISLMIVVVMMIFFRVKLSYHILFIIPGMVVLMILTFGLMCFEMHCGVYIDDLKKVNDIVFKLLFYLTGIIFNIDQRIGKNYPELATILGKWNPVAYLISSIRNALIYNQSPNWKWILIWLVISLLLCMAGIRLVYRNENNYVKGI
ncbi:MAG: ABC transporter permease [Eubacterium sp.]|nr:ABC transporter permease [Eubacterium sp.]